MLSHSQSSWLCSAISAVCIQRAGVDAGSCRHLLCMLVATFLHSRSSSFCSAVSAACTQKAAMLLHSQSSLFCLAVSAARQCTHTKGRAVHAACTHALTMYIVVDIVDAHILSIFAQSASTNGRQADRQYSANETIAMWGSLRLTPIIQLSSMHLQGVNWLTRCNKLANCYSIFCPADENSSQRCLNESDRHRTLWNTNTW